ncbi:MAG: hypothetical protein AB1757_03615 [Acidobacteriota bacterium]
METGYLNTDLVIDSKDDLSPIVEAFGDRVLVLHHGEIGECRHAAFELTASGLEKDPETTIKNFCLLVESLPEEVREIWDACGSRILDIGYESGIAPFNFESEISAATLQRVAGIGASIKVTIYAYREVNDAQ